MLVYGNIDYLFENTRRSRSRGFFCRGVVNNKVLSKNLISIKEPLPTTNFEAKVKILVGPFFLRRGEGCWDIENVISKISPIYLVVALVSTVFSELITSFLVFLLF